MVCNDQNLTNWKFVNEEVIVAGGGTLPVMKIGSLKVKFRNSKGEDSLVFLPKVKFVPNLKLNLFSITLGMPEGWKVEYFDKLLTVKKGNEMISFHKKLPLGMSFLPCAEEITQERVMIISPRKQFDFKSFHDLLGHASIENTRRTALRLGLKLTGKILTCEDCLLAKMRRKNINKLSKGRSILPGERLLIDISYIRKKSLGGKDTWLLIEDQATSMKWNFFMRRKGELINQMMTFIKKLKAEDSNKVKYIQLDNEGEYLGLKSKIEAEGLSIKLEFTSPETPEQNGQVERSFATLWGRVRAMLTRAGVPQELREKLWAECASTATKLSNIIPKKNGKSALFEYYGEEPGYTNELRLFGEIGTKLSKLYGLPDKLSNKGSHCMFVGFAEDHPRDTYRVLDLKT
jgi:hypothetical protein